MRPKRDAGVTAAALGATTRVAGASGSTSSYSARLKPRKTASKEAGGKTGLLRGRKPNLKSPNLTAVRVAHIISQLDNKRGSTMDSIRSKLVRSGYKSVNTPMIRIALERAVKSGLLREIREERFSLPNRSASNINSGSNTSNSSRASAKVAQRVASKGQQQPHYHQSRKQAMTSASRTSKRFQRRRPPQGRRPANGESGADDNDEVRDMDNDNDAGVGDGDVEAESGSGSAAKNTTSSRVSVSEPVAGCDAVMVFGTH